MARDKASYVKHIGITSESNRKQFLTAYGTFSGIEDLIDSKPGEEELYDYVQNWINGMDKSQTIVRTYFSQMKKYLHYRGVKMNPLDVSQCLRFPARYEEDLHPLGIDEFHRILAECDRKRRAMYLAQSSSGMRIGEMVQIRRGDLDTDMERIMVKIPSWMTKKRRGRTTFFSAEAAKALMPRLRKLEDGDLVFGTSKSAAAARNAEIAYLGRVLSSIGLDQKYEVNGRRKISTHSFRAFFITRVSRHDPTLAKYFAGQRGYLMQYDRLTDEERLENYMKFEPSLLVYDQTRNREKIRRLEEEAAQIRELKAENGSLRRRMLMLEEHVFKAYLSEPIRGRAGGKAGSPGGAARGNGDGS